MSFFSAPSANRTTFLMRLNLAAYPTCAEGLAHDKHCEFSDATLQELWDQQESLYGPEVGNAQEEFDAANQFQEDNWEYLKSDGLHYTKHSIPSSTAEFQVGVQALELTAKDSIVLAFRGTYSPGDYSNIENWVTDFLLEKSTERMKHVWTQDAALNWTAAMQSRGEAVDDRWAKLEIRTQESYKRHKYAQLLVDATAANETLSKAIGGLSLEDVHDTGYWKLTKHLVDQVAARAKESNQTLILTGHSQGGTRAQLASMYLHHTQDQQPVTVTFAATGSACVARHLFDTKSDLLQDLDPDLDHSSHLTDFAHPLDPWGNSMLGMDNGQVCYYEGEFSRNVHEYCSRIYGWSGPTLIAAQAGAYSGLGWHQASELTRNFQRCRYFTHTAEGMLLGLLSSQASLLAEGPNNPHCHEAPVIPLDNPQGQCPTGKISREEVTAVWVLAFIVAIFVFGTICCLRCCCCSCSRRKQKEEDPTHTLRQGIDHSEGSEPWRDDDEDVDNPEGLGGIELL